jgi:hypothetical protein
MSFFKCICNNNLNDEEKIAIDLLNIKNLEKTLKNNENKILKKDTNMDLNDNLIIQK